MRRRQFQRFRKIGENSPQAWRDLSQFGRFVSQPLTDVIQARRLSQITLDDLGKREVGNRFVSFVAAPDGASEAKTRRVLRQLQREAGLTHPGSVREHNNRPVAGHGTIDDRANRAGFRFPPHKRGSFRLRELQNIQHYRDCLIGTRWSGNATWLLCWFDGRTCIRRSEFPHYRENGVRLVGAEGARPDASSQDICQRGIALIDSLQY